MILKTRMPTVLNIPLKVLVTRSCPILKPHGLEPVSLLCPWDSPGKNSGVGCHALLQGTFLTQGSNPPLLDCRQILYHMNPPGKPRYTFMDPEKKKFINKC